MTEARGSTGLNSDAYPPGTPCGVSLMVHGMAATREFYGALFGWEFQPGPRQLGPYVRALLDGREVAGIGQLPPDRHLPIAWTPYFASADVDLTAETVRHRGGTVGVGPLDVGDTGRLAIASDPAGAVFGIRQAAEHLGADISGAHGTPAWVELLTMDTSLVTKFYGAAFGYAEEPVASDELDYVTLHVKGHSVAGIHGVGNDLPRDRGPHWLTYFEVADPDEATHRVIELGGHVIKPPHETPHGLVAGVADPEGAKFAMVHRER